MNQRIAVITGAGRGIGRATAIELTSLGYRTLLTARNKAELAETAALAEGASILPGDVTSIKHARRLIEKASSLGKLEVIVNNVGYAPALSIEQITPSEWEKILATNVSAALYLCQFAWPIFVKQRGGVMVNISSVASRDPFPGLGPYGAAKAALNILGMDLARQGRPHGIRVHTIAPGAVETQMLRGLISTKELSAKETLRPEDIAKAVAACVSGPLMHTSGEVVFVSK